MKKRHTPGGVITHEGIPFVPVAPGRGIKVRGNGLVDRMGCKAFLNGTARVLGVRNSETGLLLLVANPTYPSYRCRVNVNRLAPLDEETLALLTQTATLGAKTASRTMD